MGAIEIKKTVNIDETIREDRLTGALYTGEKNAHKFLITCESEGGKKPVTGTVTARMLRASGPTVFLTGTVEDGCACVTLAADCYNVPGSFRLTIYETENEETTAVYCAKGDVISTQSGELIDGSGAIPKSVDDVAAAIEAAGGGKPMVGATAETAGEAGLVPAPAAGDQLKYLRGDGTWDDLRTMLYAAFPAKMEPASSMGILVPSAPQTGASDAAVGVPPQQISINITAENGASQAVLTMKGYIDTIMGGGTVYTIDLTALNGGQPLPNNANVNIYDGVRMEYYTTVVYLSEPIVQKDSYFTLTCDVGNIGMVYRQGINNVLSALDNRITALENA